MKEVRDACDVFASLRQYIAVPPTTTASSEKLWTYYLSLNFVVDECGIDAIESSLKWTSAFNTREVSQFSYLSFDKLSAFFNLAVNECRLGINASVEDFSDEKKFAITKMHFERAAGMFDEAGNFLMPTSMQNVTTDI